MRLGDLPMHALFWHDHLAWDVVDQWPQEGERELAETVVRPVQSPYCKLLGGDTEVQPLELAPAGTMKLVRELTEGRECSPATVDIARALVHQAEALR